MKRPKRTISRGKPRPLTHQESDHLMTIIELREYFVKINDHDGIDKYNGILSAQPCYTIEGISWYDFCINPSIVEEYLDTAYANIASLMYQTINGMAEEHKVFLRMKWGDEILDQWKG